MSSPLDSSLSAMMDGLGPFIASLVESFGPPEFPPTADLALATYDLAIRAEARAAEAWLEAQTHEHATDRLNLESFALGIDDLDSDLSVFAARRRLDRTRTSFNKATDETNKAKKAAMEAIIFSHLERKLVRQVQGLLAAMDQAQHEAGEVGKTVRVSQTPAAMEHVLTLRRVLPKCVDVPALGTLIQAIQAVILELDVEDTASVSRLQQAAEVFAEQKARQVGRAEQHFTDPHRKCNDYAREDLTFQCTDDCPAMTWIAAGRPEGE